MTCGQDNRTTIGLLGTRLQVDSLDTYHLVAFDDEGGHLGLEMHLATTVKDGVTHVFYHTRQFVGSYMRMGISQDIGVGSMLAEDIQNLVHTAAFLAAGIQFSIAVGTCSTLTKTVVALGIHLLGLGNIGEVLLALAHVLAPFEHHRTIAQLDESQGSKKTARSLAHHDHTRT